MDVISLILSVFAILISVYTFYRTQKMSMMPVLVFVRRSKKAWQIQNVGNGPAIAVEIADRDWGGEWKHVILFYPIAAGASLDLPLLENGAEFGAIYTDIKRRTYSTLCSKNINEFFEKNKFPKWKSAITEWELNEKRKEAQKYL